MIITVNDLDKEVKNNLRGTIMTGLFQQYSTLPIELEKISPVVSQLKDDGSLDESVKNYYSTFSGSASDINVDISSEDYMRVWLHTT